LSNHSQHAKVFAWLNGKSLVVCPLGELGFLRISANKKAINAPMNEARSLLEKFREERKVEWIANDLRTMDSKAESSEEVTDHYLADLAQKHGLKLATLDQNLRHPGAELIA
jgi:predicted nucleic acid-binding protein